MKNIICLLALCIIASGSSNANDFGQMMSALSEASLPIINLSLDSASVNSETFVEGSIEVARYGEEPYKLRCLVRHRGAISLHFEKKNYAIKLIDEDGDDYDYDMLGIRKTNSWILDGMQADRMRMANRTCFDTWNTMSQTPYETDYGNRNGIVCRYVELYVNGYYGGLYSLSDKTDRKLLGLKKTVGSNGRVAYKGILYKCTCLNTTSAYFLTTYKTMATTGTTWNSWELDYPADYPSEEAWSPLINLIDEFQGLTEEEFLEKYEQRFYDYNVIDYAMLINGLYLQDCAYKNAFLSLRNVSEDEHFLISPWDMDYSLGHMGAWNYGYELNIYNLENRMPYNYLFQLESGDFKQRMKERWEELRVGAMHPDSLMGRMRGYADEMTNSGAWQREYDKWGRDSGYYYVPLNPSIDEQMDEMEKWYKKHYDYIDIQYQAISEVNGILTHKANEPQGAKTYNLQGMEVDANYRGIVIRQGKKYLQK